MKKILTILLIGALILTSGCSSAVGSSGAPSNAPEPPTSDSPPENMSNAQARPSDFPGVENQNEVLGKIISVSENTITLAIGTINRPANTQGGRGAPPDRQEGGPPRQDRSDGSPPGEPPADGRMVGPGGFPGDFTDLEYSGEEVSYTLEDSVVITKGMGENYDALTISDLAKGDIIRLQLDDDEQPVSVQVLGASE